MTRFYNAESLNIGNKSLLLTNNHTHNVLEGPVNMEWMPTVKQRCVFLLTNAFVLMYFLVIYSMLW